MPLSHHVFFKNKDINRSVIVKFKKCYLECSPSSVFTKAICPDCIAPRHRTLACCITGDVSFDHLVKGYGFVSAIVIIMME